MLSRDVPVKVVSEMLGHADVSTTLSIYAHVLPDMQGPAADAMDDLLGYPQTNVCSGRTPLSRGTGSQR
jgi:hypothetical protein